MMAQLNKDNLNLKNEIHLKNGNDPKNKANIKNEGYLKNKADIKNGDNLKKENNQKNEADLKNEDDLKDALVSACAKFQLPSISSISRSGWWLEIRIVEGKDV